MVEFGAVSSKGTKGALIVVVGDVFKVALAEVSELTFFIIGTTRFAPDSVLPKLDRFGKATDPNWAATDFVGSGTTDELGQEINQVTLLGL